MNRARPLLIAVVLAIAGTTLPARRSPRPAPFNVFEASILEMQSAMKAGRTTSRAIVQQYLTRIALYEDKLRAAITVNPKAIEEADARDRDRAHGRILGPLHGIPIALKDNIHTTDMPTTGGALAFEHLVPPYEATLARNLRAGGAIIIAKTGMTELANFVTTGMPTNYNAVHGYGMNPYDPRRDPRETADGRPVLMPGGSSSGIGTAANFWAGNVGTETSGSILTPANQNMLAAVKPTVGRISRYGVIPITADQDTPGPMAKFVADVAIMLGVLESVKPDGNDPATTACRPPPANDYTKLLRPDGLKGARIGIPRANYYEPFTIPGTERPRGGLNPAQVKVMDEAIAALKAAGATVVDIEIPSIMNKEPKENLLLSGSSVVLRYGMKRDFNAWLASLGPAAPVKNLTELREWNKAHERRGAIKYGQTLLDASDAIDLQEDRARYDDDRARDIRLGGTNGIDAAVKRHNLDALLFPGASAAGIASKPGYPTVMVPFGMIPNVPAAGAPAAAADASAPVAPAAPFPPGFDPKPQPYGVGFTGPACSEPRLLQLAYAFEHATRRRTPPPGLR